MDELNVSTPTAFRQWADELTPDLVSRVADCCTPKDYASCRAVCRAWRTALPSLTSLPLAPVAAADGTGSHKPAAVSLGVWSHHAQRWGRLVGLHQPSGLDAKTCRCVGGRDDWLALVGAAAAAAEVGSTGNTTSVVLLFNPLTGAEISLHTSLYDPKCERAPNVVFSPSPTTRDFAAVSICRPNRLAVQRATDGRSSTLIFDTDTLMDGAVLADIRYCDEGKVVYCLTTRGAVHVLHLNNRRLCRRGRLRAVEVEPLVTGTDVFSTPYDTIVRHTDAKNVVLCDGVLYQVWRRPGGAGSAVAPAGIADQRPLRISEGDVFVLRYDSRARGLCWQEVDDLGGYAVFLGANEAVAVRVEVSSEFVGNCLYYWASRTEGGYEAFMFNMAYRGSVRRLPVAGGVSSPL